MSVSSREFWRDEPCLGKQGERKEVFLVAMVLVLDRDILEMNS